MSGIFSKYSNLIRKSRKKLNDMQESGLILSKKLIILLIIFLILSSTYVTLSLTQEKKELSSADILSNTTYFEVKQSNQVHHFDKLKKEYARIGTSLLFFDKSLFFVIVSGGCLPEYEVNKERTLKNQDGEIFLQNIGYDPDRVCTMEAHQYIYEITSSENLEKYTKIVFL